MGFSEETNLVLDPDATAGRASALEAKPDAFLVDLSIIIPVFNEESRIIETITSLADYLQQQGENYEIIISDDGSRDGGPEQVKEWFGAAEPVRLLRERQHQGKGAAVRRGVLAARGDVIIFMDADLSYPVETIGFCLDCLQEFDIVIGSRNLPESGIEITPPPLRRLAGPVFKALVRRLALPGFTDTQCGFKGFRSAAAHEIFLSCEVNGFAFDVEVLALAQKFGYRITEVPVRLVVDSSDSHINLTTDPLRMIADIIRIRRRVMAKANVECRMSND